MYVHYVSDVRQTEIHTAEPLVPEPSAFVVEMATKKLKDTNHWVLTKFPAELIKAAGRTFSSEIQQLINSIWNKDKLTKEWKELIIVPNYKKGGKTFYSNYRGTSRLSTTYKILSTILLSRLTPYAEEIIWDHQCGFQHNRSTNY
jgi:hypothetical protein